MRWAYGVTTCRERVDSYLPPTVSSLAKAGFDRPRLFMDGCCEGEASQFPGLPFTCHIEPLGVFGNWITALWELYIREPDAERFILFQDDVELRVTKEELEAQQMPYQGYCNLYMPHRTEEVMILGGTGWRPSEHLGIGALALMFDRDGVIALLGSRYILDKPASIPVKNRALKLDGAIMIAMRNVGWREYVHCPSLVVHRGMDSSVGHSWEAAGTATLDDC